MNARILFASKFYSSMLKWKQEFKKKETTNYLPLFLSALGCFASESIDSAKMGCTKS